MGGGGGKGGGGRDMKVEEPPSACMLATMQTCQAFKSVTS